MQNEVDFFSDIVICQYHVINFFCHVPIDLLWNKVDLVTAIIFALRLMTHITYRQYVGESDLPHIMALVQNELSEPYVIYTFRYFLHQWYVKLVV